MTTATQPVSKQDYYKDGAARARSIPNRGPVRFEADGRLARDIHEAYDEFGYYIFQKVIDEQELDEVYAEMKDVIARAPAGKDSPFDAQGRPALGVGRQTPLYVFARPLSDPLGGTSTLGGRHAVQMEAPAAQGEVPKVIVFVLQYTFDVMDTSLRLSAHPDMLRVAEAIAGPDFVPFSDNFFNKEPGIGASTSWHQDGLTKWNDPDWHSGSHGFNLIGHLTPATPANGLWVIPGTHGQGRVDLAGMSAAIGGSDRLPTAVPVLCERGDVVIVNRQLVHGAFANESPDRRASFHWGFYPRASVLGTKSEDLDGTQRVYTDDYIDQRSRFVQVAIDARHQHRPDEVPYSYAPFRGREHECRWSPKLRETLFHDYGSERIFL